MKEKMEKDNSKKKGRRFSGTHQRSQRPKKKEKWAWLRAAQREKERRGVVYNGREKWEKKTAN